VYKHHKEAIENITNKMRYNNEVLAVIVGGSIAHGFANEGSDIDLMLLVSNDSCSSRMKNGSLHYYETEACNYEGGYIDGKYICMDFVEKVGRCGSEPARFAFEGAFVTYSRIPGIERALKTAARYPVEQKEEKIRKFFAQLEAWRWYYFEGLKRQDEYLINQALANLTLFGGRLILAHNEILYPYHKWFIRVLEGAKNKPENFIERLQKVIKYRNMESVEDFYSGITEMKDWTDKVSSWPNQFMLDSELTWMSGKTPVGDI
jgi:hypothetical protein